MTNKLKVSERYSRQEKRPAKMASRLKGSHCRWLLGTAIALSVVAIGQLPGHSGIEAASHDKPLFNFQDVRNVRATFRGTDSATQALQSAQAIPRALAQGDLDGNGTPDVVAGYANRGTGIVTIQRGNPDAFAPTDDSVFARLVQGYNPESLVSDTEVHSVPVPADFLAVGNFDHRFAKDILFAAKGGGLYLMAGDNKGRFGEPEQIALPGSVTALAVGEFRAADGFTDVAVGVTGPRGEALLIFDGVEGFSEPLLEYQLSDAASAIEFGGLDADPFLDAAVAAGSELLVVHGWGRKEPATPASRVERVTFGSKLRGLALGAFAWDREGRSEMAALTDDGTVQIVQHEKLDMRPFTESEKAERTRGKIKVNSNNRSVDVETVRSWQPGQSAGWTKADRHTASGVSSASFKSLLRTHLSGREMDDLMLIGENQSKLELLHPTGPNVPAPDTVSSANDLVRATLDVTSEPLAVLPLPQKLNGVIDLVVLRTGIATPSIIPTAAGTTITVDRTDDPSGALLIASSSCTGAANDCSLRGAFQYANNGVNPGTIIMLPAGTYILGINGTNAGGCDGNTVGDLGANQSTTITGAGAATTIIRQTGTGPANDGDRIMCMNEPFTVGLVYNFSGVTFVGGREGTAAGGGTVLGGAGIIGGELNNSLTLTNVVFANNQETVAGSANLGGGGIQITGGNLIITNSTFGGSSAPGAYTDRSSTTTANLQTGSGGGVAYTPSSPAHTGGSGTLTVTGSTFSRNTAAGIGGGGADLFIFAFAAPGGIGSGSASIGTTTFSNNQAISGTGGSGGGIVVESLPTTVATTSLTNNSASNRGGAIYVGGGSLVLDGTGAGVTMSGNTATNGGTSVSTAAPVNVSGTSVTLGGSIEVSTGGVWTNNTGSTLTPTDVVVVGGTFNMNNSTMNVGGNLTIGPAPVVGATFNGNTGTVNIQGNFVLNAGGAPATTLNAGTGTFNFNGTGAQSITNGTSITFNNLTDSNVNQPLAINNSFAVGGTLNVNGAAATLAPAAGSVISGIGTLTGTGTARVTRIAATADFLSQYTISNKTLTNLTVDYIGSAAQVLSAITYGPLKITNASGVNEAAGTATVNGLLTLSTGTLNVQSSTLIINNGITVGTGGLASGATGTVNYNQGSAGQNVLAANYGNLTFSSQNKVLASSGTIGIAGLFTPGAAVGHTITGSTINFNGTGSQTIPAFNYNNLTSSSTGARTLANAGTIGVAGLFTPGTNAYTITGSTIDFNGAGAQTISAFNYNNLTSSNTGGRTLANSGTIGIAGAFNQGANAYTITGSTINFNGAGAQTIPAFNYNNLASSNAGARTLANTGTIGIAGAFTPGTNAYTITGSIINFNGGGPQTIPAFNYNNLTSSNAGARTLANAGTIGIAEIFTAGTNVYTITGSTINFNGTAGQTIPAFNYNNLTSSNTGARTLANSGIVGIAGVFTPGTNAYTITGSTISYNGTAAQTVPSGFSPYNNLTLNNAAGVSGFAGLTVQGLLRIQQGTFTSSSTYNSVQIDSGATLSATAASTINIGGSWTNNGTFNANTGTVVFNGASAQTISGTTTFNNLTINNTNGVSFGAGTNVTVGATLTLTAGAFAVGTNTLTLNGTVTATSGTLTSAATGTVSYNQGSNGQSVLAANYGNLTFSNFTKILPSSSTVGIAGLFTTGAAAGHTITGSTVDFNGAGAQTIPAFNYNNLTSSNTGARTLVNGGTIGIAGAFTPGTNVYTITGSTVTYNGTSAQLLPSSFSTYNNLTLNNAAGTTGFAGLTTLGLLRIQAGTFTSSSTYKDVQIDIGATLAASSGSTINVSGNWTNNGTFTPNNGTVNFNGSLAQTIGGSSTTTFNNLTINNSSGVSLGADIAINATLTLQAGALGIASRTLTLNNAILIASGSFTSNANGTVNYNQSSNGQSIAPGNYGNLTFSNFQKTLPGSGIVKIAGTFTTGAGGGHTLTGSTVEFNGGGAQTLPSNFTTYNNLTLNNAAGATGFAGLVVQELLRVQAGTFTTSSSFKDVQIDNGATLAATAASTINVSGNWTNDGTFTANTGTVNYNGAAAQTIGGSSTTTFNSLTINNAAGVILGANAVAGGVLQLTNGNLDAVANTMELTSSGSITRTSGHVLGNLKKSFGATGLFIYHVGTANGYSPVDVNVTAGSGNLTVKAVQGPQPIVDPVKSLQRYWTLTGSGVTTDLTFHYLDGDVMGNETIYRLIKVSGSTALIFPASPPTVDPNNNIAFLTGVQSFSDWTAGEPTAPTAVEAVSVKATEYEGGTFIEWHTASEINNLGFNIYREEGDKRVPVTSQMLAGSALVAGSGVALRAGQSYSWWDAAASKSAQYWLESVDLNGRSEWHGPFVPKFVGGERPSRGNSTMLIRTGNAQAGLTLPLEQAAAPQSLTPQQIALQSGLAGQAAVKMWIKREGFYRVTAAELAAAGLDPRTDTRLLQMFVDGQQIPINVISDKDGLLSAVEFYGRGVDAAFTDQRVYWLLSGSQPGLRIKQTKGAGRPSDSQSFLYTAERKDRTIYFAALRNGERENFFGPVIAASPVDQSITIQHVDQSAIGTATIEIALQGVTTLPHKVWVYLNGTFAGEVSFEGQSGSISRFNVAQSLLRSGDNQVRFVAQAGPTDITLLDYIRLSYWHSFIADDNALRLTTPGNQEVTVGGFSSETIRVFDVTDSDAPEELKAKIEQQKTGFAVTATSPGPGERRLLAIADNLTSAPAKIAANQPSGLRTPAHVADFVILARREFFAAIEPLRALRRNQGLKVELADIEDVFDEFTFGTKSPQAVKDFLLYATTSWKVRPRYVLLVGDASYDGKNYLGFGDWDLVPTRLIDTGLMETASDDALADFNADGIADLAVGRLAGRTPAEVSAMVRKIIGYENSEPLESMLLVADANNGFDFETATTQLRALIPGNLRVEQVNRGQLGDATAKNRLIEAITRGQKVVNYMGHGSVNLWSGSLLTNEDAANLTNGERLPLFVMMTCLNGYFHDPALDSLGESLLKTESGGAIAVWTSAGMTTPGDQSLLNKQLYQLLFQGGSAVTLGEATARAKAAVGDGDIRRTWVLLGDPTTRLK